VLVARHSHYRVVTPLAKMPNNVDSCLFTAYSFFSILAKAEKAAADTVDVLFANIAG
jgi:hypothetical protein